VASSPHLEFAPPPGELVELGPVVAAVLAGFAGVRSARLCTCTVGDGRTLPTVVIEVGREVSRDLRSRLGGEVWKRLRAAGAALPGLNVLVVPGLSDIAGLAGCPEICGPEA